MAKTRQIGMEPWRFTQPSEVEVVQATYDRLARKYKGLDSNIIRSAWRRHLDAEPTDQIVEGIRTGKRLRFK